MDVVTFTITLPTAGPLPEYIVALRNARDSQAATGHPDAAQALTAVLALAERGLIEFQAKDIQREQPK